jgi:integrase
MGIVKRFVKGKWVYGVSRRLPVNKLGMKRFRRWYENKRLAGKVLDILNGAIATGHIDGVLPGLVHTEEQAYTVASFWIRFRDEYCKPRMTSWKRYQLSFESLNAHLGIIPLEAFRREHLHGFVEKRVKEVSASTCNKDIAAIKKMFSYALEVGAIQFHPLVKFRTIKVQETALRVPTADEFHKLVDSMPEPELAALVAVLGETGMRKGEALGLTWDRLDLLRRRMQLEKTKGKKVRSVPLSEFAVEKLRSLIRFVHQPRVFVHPNGKPWTNPDKKFRAGRKAAGMPWVTFHTLRHYRGTSWLDHGADIKSVQESLGHADIQTTMRYLKHVQSRTERAIREAQEREKESDQIVSEREKNGRGDK